MFCLVIAILILVGSLVFFMVGMHLLSKDRRLNRPFMPMKTRVFYALGNVGIAFAIYMIRFWLEEEIIWTYELYRISFAVCMIVAVFFEGVAMFYLVNSNIKIRYKDGMGDAANQAGMQMPAHGSAPASASNPALNAAYCPQCGNARQAGHLFCSICGAPIESAEKAASRVCSSCGTKVEHENIYCPNCGHRI